MDGFSQVDRDELIRRMRSAFEKTMSEVVEAVNAAPDGHWIDASEERCRDVLGEFRRKAYETAMQMKVEATETNVAFPPSPVGASRDSHADGADQLRAGAGAAAALRKARRPDGRAGG